MCQSDPPTGKPEQSNKTLLKEMHNAVEKRRRDKINTTIQELKDLIPGCRNVANNKAAILTQASEHIRHMSVANSNLMEASRRLQACLLPSLSLSLLSYFAPPPTAKSSDQLTSFRNRINTC
jgi:hypothetical protein